MAKFQKFKKNEDVEALGFIAGAALSIPALIVCGFVIASLIRTIF